MAHELMGNANTGKYGFAEVQGNKRQRAWTHLGETVDVSERISAVALAEKAGLNYKIGKFPIATFLPKKDPKNLETIIVDNQMALVRDKTRFDPERKVIGIVSKNYSIVQNIQLAEWLDEMKGWNIETCGALGIGERVFFAMALGSWEIAGDEIQEYFLVTDTKDGTGGLQMCYTPVRVVCQNTLTWGLESAKNRISLVHSKLVKREAQELIKIFNRMTTIKKEGENALKQLLEVKIPTHDTAKEMIEMVFPEPKKPGKLQLLDSLDGAETVFENITLGGARRQYENQKENVRIYRAKTEDLYDRFNDEYPKAAETGYALYNSVSEFTDHYQNSKNAQTRAESALFGERARTKSEAFALILNRS